MDQENQISLVRFDSYSLMHTHLYRGKNDKLYYTMGVLEEEGVDWEVQR